MELYCLFFRRSKDLEVSTEMVNRPDIGDELSRLYDQLLTELIDPDNIDLHTADIDNDDERPQIIMLLRS